MKRTPLKTISLGILALAAASFASGQEAAPANKPRPNIVFFNIDDLGWADVGFSEQGDKHTPHIDQLAAESLQFTKGYAASPMCSPSRGAIMSGRFPARFGMTDFIHGDGWGKYKEFKVRPPRNIWKGCYDEQIGLGEPLKKAGYRTLYVGKGHFGTQPRSVGFGERIQYSGGNHMARFPDGERFMTQVKADETCAWIHEHKDEPFFVYVNTHAVHVPLGARVELVRKYLDKGLEREAAIYAAMCEEVDLLVGQVRATLEDLGLTERTLIIFTSDNGGVVPAANNSPLRAGKGSLYEGGIRVPFLFSWPGVIEPGVDDETLCTHTDIYPTLLAAVGLPLKPEQHVDGVNLWPALTEGETPERREYGWHYPHYNFHWYQEPSSAYLSDEWKLIQFHEDGRLELYNLDEDIGEQTNLAGEMPEKVDEMFAKLEQWKDSVGAKMPTPNPDYNPKAQKYRVNKRFRVEYSLDRELLKRLESNNQKE